MATKKKTKKKQPESKRAAGKKVVPMKKAVKKKLAKKRVTPKKKLAKKKAVPKRAEAKTKAGGKRTTGGKKRGALKEQVRRKSQSVDTVSFPLERLGVRAGVMIPRPKNDAPIRRAVFASRPFMRQILLT